MKIQDSSSIQIFHEQKQKRNKQSLFNGLDIVGKKIVPQIQWLSHFSQEQYQHNANRINPIASQNIFAIYGKSLQTKINNFANQTCSLCMSSKTASQFQSVGNCIHKFCYSCLNSYSICRINSNLQVACPNSECSSVLSINSNIFRYLPLQIQTKYLQNKNQFKYQRKNLNKLCVRCLQDMHIGPCKVTLDPQQLKKSYKYRVCKKCQKQAIIKDGRKRVTCQQCGNYFCYLCGQEWINAHACKKSIDELNNIEENTNVQYCTCCDPQITNNCHCFQSIKWDDCCGNIFYCQGSNCIIICIFNIGLFILRSIGILCLILSSLFLLIPYFIAVILWIFLCLIAGFTLFPFILFTQNGMKQFLLIILFLPLVGLVGWFVTMIYTFFIPFFLLAKPLTFITQLAVSIWKSLSPRGFLEQDSDK